jgi:formylglycine-generating enzyme required for sulfatase activity
MKPAPALLTALLLVSLVSSANAEQPATMVNSVGMKLVRVPAGRFSMGSEPFCPFGRFWDEQPVHQVTISRDFWIGVNPVTNAEYERFDRGHRARRGKDSRMAKDDGPVVNVSWDDAVAFTKWLSQQERKPYRLATEAEWEYAALKAGPILKPLRIIPVQDSGMVKGDFLWEYATVPTSEITLNHMTGLLEQWVLDWHGPYPSEPQTDPVGHATGDFRVSRGRGFDPRHPDAANYLRPQTRFANPPADRNEITGFRVVQAPMPTGQPLSRRPVPRWAQNVSQSASSWKPPVDMTKPFFAEPREWVRLPQEAGVSAGPGPWLHAEHHAPCLTYTPNGDLLAMWFATGVSTESSGFREIGKELTFLGTRFRRDTGEWDVADHFFHVASRNAHAGVLWTAPKGTIFHWHAVGLEGVEDGILVQRESRDNGRSWSQVRIVDGERRCNLPNNAGALQMTTGRIILPGDLAMPGVPWGDGLGTCVHASDDHGRTWTNLGRDRTRIPQVFSAGGTGSNIAGYHGAVAEYINPQKSADSYLIAFGRSDAIDGHMPMSMSRDGGANWTYSASPFLPVSGGQRPALIRLREGPIVLFTFAGHGSAKQPGFQQPMVFVDRDGREFEGRGLFAALSHDGGKTWPQRKLITDGKTRTLNTRSIFLKQTLTHDRAEPRGYLSSVQTPDGMIHLISSGIHYQFNFAWLKEPANPQPAKP